MIRFIEAKNCSDIIVLRDDNGGFEQVGTLSEWQSSQGYSLCCNDNLEFDFIELEVILSKIKVLNAKIKL